MKEVKIYETVKVKEQVPFEKDSRIKSDSKGKYVTVEPWGSKKGANDCLERIITNSYDLDAMGIKVYNKDGSYTKEFKALEKAVMDANPSIYGDKNGKGGHKDHPDLDGTRHNKIIYTGDKIYLPKYSVETGKTEKKPVGTKMEGTGKYEYVSKNPPTWTKTTTVTKVPLPSEPEPAPTVPSVDPTPQPDPVPGPPGKDGVGVKNIELKDGYFIFTMTDGTEIKIDASDLIGPAGKNGVGIKETKLEGDKLVFIMTDGTKQEIDASGLKGANGENGVGIDKIEIKDGKIVFTMTDGTKQEIDASAFKGEKGDDGRGIEKEWMEGEHRFVKYTDGTVVDLGDIMYTAYDAAVDAGFKGTKEDWQIMQLPLIPKEGPDGKLYWSYGGVRDVTDKNGNKVPCSSGAINNWYEIPEKAEDVDAVTE